MSTYRVGLPLAVMTMVALAATAAPIYKTVDAQGNVTYSDAPEPGQRTQEIELPPVNIQLPPESPADADPAPPPTMEAPRLRITQPANDATVPVGQLAIEVAVELEPGLAPEQRIQWLLDERRQGMPVTALDAVLTDLERGSHQLSAVVLDSANQVVARSEAITIHVHRASAKHRNRRVRGNPPPPPPPSPTPTPPPPSP